jgi:hypothetical protein
MWNQVISTTGFEMQGEPAAVSYLFQRENITTKSTKDTKGSQIEKKLRDLRVLRGKQTLSKDRGEDRIENDSPLWNSASGEQHDLG